MKQDWFYKGKQSLEESDADGAVRSFAKSIREGNVRGIEYLLYSYLLQSDYKEIARILEKNPVPEGFSLYTQYWFRFMTGDLLDLSELLEKMLLENNFLLRIFAARELHRTGKRNLFSKSIREKLECVGLHYEFPLEERRGSILKEIVYGNARNSVLLSRSLLKQYSGIGDVYLDLIETVSVVGDHALIREVLEHPQVKKAGNQDFRVLYRISKEWYRLKDYEKSRYGLKKLTGYFRHNPVFYHQIGNTYLAQKNYVKAVEPYNQAIETAPLFERAFYNRGIAYFQLGELNRAISDFEEAVRLCKKPDALFNLSVCLIEKKELQNAYYCLKRIPETHTKIFNPELIQRQIRDLATFT